MGKYEQSVIIELEGKQYALKQSFHALMEFEKVSGKDAFEVTASMKDTVMMFFAMLKAANRMTFNYSFDQFLDILDRSPYHLAEYKDFLLMVSAVKPDANGEITKEALDNVMQEKAWDIPLYKRKRAEYKAELN